MVLIVLVLLLAEGALAGSATIMLLQEVQWCSSCLCIFSRRRHRLGSDGCCWCSGDRRRVLSWKEASAW